MTKELPPLLVVDDERNMRLSLETVMTDEGYEACAAESAEEGLKLLKKQEFFVVITDARLGGMSGYDFLRAIKKSWPDLPVLMITAYATPKLAVDAIKSGAIDYLAKPFAPEELLHAVSRCAERHQLLLENAALKEKSGESFGLDRIVGESENVETLRELIRTVAPTNATVLVLGESGTGKELIAGAIHALSHRREENYVRINCAAIPEQLLESELFGHEKGAFTGAIRNKVGRVEEADGGTIFLDEIGDMSRPLQAKLLRFLEDGTFTRVGGNQELRVDVRLIAATNRDIVSAIKANAFREDLFHRLNVVQFMPPALRERGGDVLLLANFFLEKFNRSLGKQIEGFSKETVRMLEMHHWPGNIRELRNAIERCVILESESEIQPKSLPDFKIEARLRKGDSDDKAGVASLEDLVANYERDCIMNSLADNHYSLNETADFLKVSRHSLRYRMHRLNIKFEHGGDDDTVVPEE
ncbi:sigma-54 dependent transcriptional regulator [bacterium]|jgi:DNA-binding NtrC family response regulator|nr:sigma-54 dependent transcriptional regulator [Verrucomicrobiota bacterium]MDA7633402.1 sigma-54 dependent transcriptional regulator [bacterium]MDA7644771.1 sigma-54 dependent transcriptional regulator [bacterium]